LGFKLGEGLSIHDALSSLGSVAEGFTTAKASHALSKKLHVELPISDQVYQVLYEHKPIRDAFLDLITRDAKAEFSI
jgi:glycerol-3-phosphate dehydrogenase (NAD(P)+)